LALNTTLKPTWVPKEYVDTIIVYKLMGIYTLQSTDERRYTDIINNENNLNIYFHNENECVNITVNGMGMDSGWCCSRTSNPRVGTQNVPRCVRFARIPAIVMVCSS